MKTKPMPPLCLELSTAREEIATCINRQVSEKHIPFYLLELLINDFAQQISERARAERVEAKSLYEKQLVVLTEGKEENNATDYERNNP